MIRLPLVLIARKYLHVGRDVQAADARMPQWDDVVDLVPDASLGGQSRSLLVDRSNSGVVSPRRRGLELDGVALCDQSVDASFVRLRPRSVALLHALSVGLSPLLKVLALPISVFVVPLLVRAGMGLFPLGRTDIGANAARARHSVRRCTPSCEVSQGLRGSAHVAAFQSGRIKARSFASFLSERWLSKVRLARLAVRHASMRAARWPLAGCSSNKEEGVQRLADAARPACLFDHRPDSICRSMMRRTSSAMEMPSRLASRIRNFLCGSVNEIICLTTVSLIRAALVFFRRHVLAVDAEPSRTGDVSPVRVGRVLGRNVLAALTAFKVTHRDRIIFAIGQFFVVLNPYQGRSLVLFCWVVFHRRLSIDIPAVFMAVGVNDGPASVRPARTSDIDRFAAALKEVVTHLTSIPLGIHAG